MVMNFEPQMLASAPGELTSVIVAGEGSPLTFLHGSGPGVSATANWWLNLPSIAQRHCVIAPDLLGFGETQMQAGAGLGIRAWVDHVLRVLDALNIDKTWLIGNSLGGWIALQLAIDHPDRVSGIVSMGTGGAVRASSIAGQAAADTSLDGVRKVLHKFVYDPSIVPEDLVVKRFKALQSEPARERFAAVVAAREIDRAEFPLTEDGLRSLHMPVLLVHGREDAIIPARRSWELHQLIPQSELHMFSKCGHWSQVEYSTDFNQLVKWFVDRHTPADARN